MSNFLKTLAFVLTLLSGNLHGQIINPDETLNGKMLNESIAAFQVTDSEAYADLFMKQAELIDASGAVILGREAILQWHKNLLKDCGETHDMKRETLSKRTRLLRPDLAVVVATTQITCGEHSGTVAYNCTLRRIDGKWYVETCAIVPVQETSPMIIEVAEK